MKKILKRKAVFKGKLVSLYVERQVFPNGYVANLEVVKHPGAVLIVPFISRDKVVLIRQYRPVINSYIWELPAGTLHKGEPHASCANRELIEETGYKAGRWKKIGLIYPAPGYTTEKIVMLAARDLEKVRVKRQEDEIIRVRVFSRKSVKRLLEAGKIVDAKTICGLKLSGVI